MPPQEDKTTYPAERVHSNAKEGLARLSICVPAYKDDPLPLLSRLAELSGVEQCTLLIYDDGSADAELTAKLTRAIDAFPAPARLITSAVNAGRSHARNRLLERAEADWLLLLDADMLPDDRGFLACYLKLMELADTPSLIAGGFSLEQIDAAPDQLLHAAQSVKSDCLSAAERSADPGRFVFTSNIVVHRDILANISFDEGYTGWGWEDVDWGLRVARSYPVLHVDNTATHMGLDKDAELIAKFGASGLNFARLITTHPEATQSMPLARMARRFKYIPFLKPLAKTVARMRFLPTPLRLIGLKTYRACAYARYM